VKRDGGYITEKEYLDREILSDTRHHYIKGYEVTRPNSCVAHCRISSNVFLPLGGFLEGTSYHTCIVDVKIKVDNCFFYPDIMVEHIEKIDNKNVFTESPVLIIEIVSDSTRAMDIATKFTAYQKIPTLEEYILIEQDFVHVQVFRRKNRWRGQVYLMGEKVDFE